MKGDAIALGALGAIALYLLTRDEGPDAGPSNAPQGLPYSGMLFATDPEPLPDAIHSAWELTDLSAHTIAGAPSLPYVRGGPWDPSRCVTVSTPHAADLSRLIRTTFPWVRMIGGPRCSPLRHTVDGTQAMSIHAVGRALDVMTPGLDAREGEQLANWLVSNAESLGLQLVIWNRRVWQGSLNPAHRFAIYAAGGSTNPTLLHRDHVHVEVVS